MKHRNVAAFLLTGLLTCFVTLFPVRTSGGETEINLTGNPQTPPPEQFKSLILKEELTIGSVEGDENTTFGSIIYFLVDDPGNIYIVDYDAKKIRKFGPDGKFIKTISRFGQGPGEFQALNDVTMLKGGTLVIADIMLKKITFFSPEGDLIKQVDLPRGVGQIQVSPQDTYFGVRNIEPSQWGQDDFYYIYTIFDNCFRPITEISKFPVDKGIYKEGLSQAQQSAFICTYFLNNPAPVKSMGEDGRIFFSQNREYRIDVYSPEGKKLMTLQRDCPPVDYGQKDRDFYFSQYNVSMGYSESLMKEIRALVRFPKQKPYFSNFISLDDGRLAAVVNTSGYTSSTLDLFDRSGRFLGRITVPISSSRLQFKNGKAYCVSPDSNGYLFIKRYSYELK